MVGVEFYRYARLMASVSSFAPRNARARSTSSNGCEPFHSKWFKHTRLGASKHTRKPSAVGKTEQTPPRTAGEQPEAAEVSVNERD